MAQLFLFLQALLGNTGVKAHFLQLGIFISCLSLSLKSEILRKKGPGHRQHRMPVPCAQLQEQVQQRVKFPYCPPTVAQSQDVSPAYPRFYRGFLLDHLFKARDPRYV